jgi:cobalamin-dependent methionine synthase I
LVTSAHKGAEAKKLYDETRVLLKRIIDQKLLKAKDVVELYPVNNILVVKFIANYLL